MAKIVIIGNGIAGVTTARHIRKLDANSEITIISSETKYFFSRTALMYVFMGHMKFEHTKPYEDFFWEKNRINLVFDRVTNVQFADKKIELKSGDPIVYDKLVLATGSKPRMFPWEGKDLKGVQSLYSAQDLMLLADNVKHAKTAVVVGGGLIGVELAEMLNSRNLEVHFIIRENHFWGNVIGEKESTLIMDHMQSHGIKLHTSSYLQKINGSSGKVNSVIIGDGSEIKCQLVGLTVGVVPNVKFLNNSTLAIDKGILVNEFLETNIKDVYALGDCAQLKTPTQGRRAIEPVWYTGRFMGQTLAKTLVGNKTPYKPGNWFNSAKFFDVEYQTYGKVPADLAANPNLKEFIWAKPENNLLMRFVFDAASNKFMGVNSFGIRLRHVAFDSWLSKGKSIEYVLSHLNDAFFDPEFFTNNSKSIVSSFEKETGTKLKSEKKSWSRILSFSNG